MISPAWKLFITNNKIYVFLVLYSVLCMLFIIFCIMLCFVLCSVFYSVLYIYIYERRDRVCIIQECLPCRDEIQFSKRFIYDGWWRYINMNKLNFIQIMIIINFFNDFFFFFYPEKMNLYFGVFVLVFSK